MATKGVKDVAALYLGAVDVKANIETFGLSGHASLTQFHPVGAVYPAPQDGGGRSGALSFNGLANGAMTTHTVLAAQASANIVCAALIDGGESFVSANPTGYRFWGIRSAILDTTDVALSPDEVHKASGNVTAAGNIDFGWLVSNPATIRQTAGNSDAEYADMGVASAATGVKAYLILPTLTLGGYTSVTVKLRHSTDHSSWADVTGGAFTANTIAGTQVLTITGVVNRYLSIAWTWQGAGSGQSFYAFVGVAV